MGLCVVNVGFARENVITNAKYQWTSLVDHYASHDAYIHKDINVDYFDGIGLGLKANQIIEKDELIFRIPKSLLISVESVERALPDLRYAKNDLLDIEDSVIAT